jgi:xanthine dehydrogenase accessory factor
VNSETLAVLNVERAARRPVIVVTEMAGGEQRLVKAEDVATDPLHAQLDMHLRNGKSKMIVIDGRKLFLTVYAPPTRLVIVGNIEISQALASLARVLGYGVTVVEPGAAFAIQERFSEVALVRDRPEVALPELNLDRYTALVVLTQDPKIDDPALLYAIERHCFYIGALGSKQMHRRRRERLTNKGATGADIGRIRSPIGLKIGAVFPTEVALSIMAEITTELRLTG